MGELPDRLIDWVESICDRFPYWIALALVLLPALVGIFLFAVAFGFLFSLLI